MPCDSTLPAPTRRAPRLRALLALAWLLLAPVAAAETGFGFEDVTARARKLAAAPYTPPEQVPQWLREISYDQWRDIRFKPAESLWRKDKLPFEVQFFHTGLYYDRAITVHVVDDGAIQRLDFDASLFDYGKNTFQDKIPTNLGFAGLRIHHPIKTKDYYDEVAVFLGASYFRAVGRAHVYGLSARGLAVDTAQPKGEEFPWFREFWLVKPKANASSLTLYALLDSPSVAGAYKFVVTPGEETTIDVDSVVFPRKAIEKLGIAPLTSMHFYGENRSQRPVNDFRPEVHDSDGLLLHTAHGEWLWRPLTNPKRLGVNAFQADNPHGFGLLQRDVNFDHYLDLEARYDLRPSAWITPKGDWGAGAVELIQIPTPNEMHDNIVAFWVPKQKVEPGKPLAYAYRLAWHVADAKRGPGGQVVGTYTSSFNTVTGSNDKWRKYIVEFHSAELAKLPAATPLEAVVEVGEGATLLEKQVFKNQVTGAWRLVFKIQPDKEGGALTRVLDNADTPPIELRAFLKNGADVLTETWTFTASAQP